MRMLDRPAAPINLLEVAARLQHEAHAEIRRWELTEWTKLTGYWAAVGLQARRDIETLTGIACAVDDVAKGRA